MLLHACPCLVSGFYESLQFALQVIRAELRDTNVRLTGRLRGTLHVVPEHGSLTLFQLATAVDFTASLKVFCVPESTTNWQ